ncbi:MAG: hypothetical protein COA52_01355 [Hyphomicrobiales bacterium]|nr:MAG: hypothetical protein COA52_00265 [Hyphomicrobiales bacterium]PCJ96879.1 MAG: hypothetical protein COA52_01355 [Hyphomicrobiales bacterium]
MKTNNPKLDAGSKKQGIMSVPLSALVPLAQAMDDGAKKYGRMNWRESKVVKSIYLDAIYRHWAACVDGEEFAEDSGVDHLGHIMACCAILYDAKQMGVLVDDVKNAGNFPDLIKEANNKKIEPKIRKITYTETLCSGRKIYNALNVNIADFYKILVENINNKSVISLYNRDKILDMVNRYHLKGTLSKSEVFVIEGLLAEIWLCTNDKEGEEPFDEIAANHITHNY